MNPEFTAQIAAGQIGAIALDASIFDKYKNRLDSGLLRRVEQFHYGRRVQVLLSDVTRGEVLAHLVRDARNTDADLRKALRDAEAAQLVSGDRAAQLLRDAADPAVIAERRMADWVARTRAEVLDSAVRVDVRRLFERYFAAQPPFAASGDKKAEFPDAAALLALEHWAEEHDTCVLLVSGDADWQHFCVGHPRLRCVGDLGAALSAFHDESAQFIGRRFADAESGSVPSAIVEAVFKKDAFLSIITFRLRHLVSSAGIDWHYVIAVKSVSWPTGSGMREFAVVDHRDGKVVIRAELELAVEVRSRFAAYMSAVGGQIPRPMDEWEVTNHEIIPIEALVTLEAGLKDRVSVVAVEFVPTTHSILLGEIEPDWDASRDVRGWNDPMV
ncbi:PIN domain-containing protein [Burkholderia ambifaria]|uniref:PIN domain-containing protein n=1 Tax=Burkholderia ambifaria TaxID=152480 RepID=UPI00158D59EA|nr:PIN domain-containing protein [Burkholderia ambifaria]